ncbi:MAG: helix-turn-helix domain-containing protein [Aquaticitalea sp.]
MTLELFKAGKSILQIPKERKFTSNTVFGRLLRYVPTGEEKVTDLILVSHYKELLELIPKLTFETLSDLKQQVDEKYTYNELQ